MWGPRGEQDPVTLQEPAAQQEDRHRGTQMLCYLGGLWELEYNKKGGA